MNIDTRRTYQHNLTRWKAAIGHLKISALTYEEILRIETVMRKKGRSDSNIKRMMTMLRIVAGYGKALRLHDARDVADTLSEMKLAAGPHGSVSPGRDQIRSIIDEADARGLFSFATGLLMQWTLMLRSVDVRGQWLPTTGGRIGPIITSERYGAPYSRYSWVQTFRRLRDHLKLPKNLTIMDTRADGITEAGRGGADPISIRDAAGHANISTTDRYMRGRSENAAKVVQLRNAAGIT